MRIVLDNGRLSALDSEPAPRYGAENPDRGAVKASKAYLAGLGTTGILLASAVLLMVVVGAVVTFNGGSVSQTLRELEGLVVDRDEPTGLSGPALAAAEAAPASRGVSSRPPGSVAAGAVRARVRRQAGRAPLGPARPAGAGRIGRHRRAPQAARAPARPSREPARASGQTAGAGSGPPAGTAPAVPGGGGGSLGQTTEGVGEGVGDAVEGVSPDLGDTVRGLGETTGGLVDGLTGGR